MLALMLAMAVFAPFLGTVDPVALSPAHRLRWPSAEYWFGSDMLGRDIYSRTIYGARVSLTVGLSVAAFATGLGLLIGLVTGVNRWVDAVVMRVMDGLMSIPGGADRHRADGADPRQPAAMSSWRLPSPRCRASPAGAQRRP